MSENGSGTECISMAQIRAIEGAPYAPWTSAQRAAHKAALRNGWAAESAGPCQVTYRRGSDYLELQLAGGEINLDNGKLTGNGRITYGHAPRHHFTTWASAAAYLDRPKGRPYRRPE